MFKCKVCGKRFELQADRRYEVLRQSNPVCWPTVYECFDCPKCGCQNMVNVREVNHDTKRSDKRTD